MPKKALLGYVVLFIVAPLLCYTFTTMNHVYETIHYKASNLLFSRHLGLLSRRENSSKKGAKVLYFPGTIMRFIHYVPGGIAFLLL